MKRIYTIILTTLLVALFAATGAIAQESGDYRSIGSGDWSDSAIWETFDGSAWNNDATFPDGSGTITIRNEDSVNVASGTVEVLGRVVVEGTTSPPITGAELNADGGTLIFADGSVYQHDRDAGSVPEASWNSGSTIEFTGLLADGPDNRDQAFHNITWNNPNQISNISLGLGTVTIGGTVRVIDSGDNRFRLTDSGSGDGQTITIEGDVIVEGGAVETTGSGSTATYNVVVNGDVSVSAGATFATSRGSGGQATWTLNGDYTVEGDARLRDSHEGDMSRIVFSGTTPQTISISPDVEYDGTINYTVAAGADVSVATGTTFHYEDDFTLNGSLAIDGEIIARDTLNVDGGTLAVNDGGTYNHAYDAGVVPIASWNAGSTIAFTGLLGDGPENRDQAFHNITWNNPDQVSNISLGLGTVTIGGTVRVVDSGGNRFRLTDSGSGDGQTITIEGDVLVEGGAIETTGSGSEATYNVVVNGDVSVSAGATFATSRGSGGQATWTLNGDFTVEGDAELRDSHEGGMSRIVFAGSSPQAVAISTDAEYNGTINYTVATGSEVSVAGGNTFHYEDDFLLNGSLTASGELIAKDTLTVDGGTFTVADGGTYNHAYDAGEIPDATWAEGSTVALTGIVTNDPDNGDQDFYNYVWNNAEQIENINIGWDDYTLRGSITVLNTNGNQFRLSSAGDEGEAPRRITIMGDVTVDGESAEFTATGSGDIFDYDVTVMGDVSITNGGFLSVSRGSGGRAVWTLYGDMTINSGEIGDSDTDKHGQFRSFVFAADTASDGVPGQTIIANDVSYDSEVYFEVTDSSGVLIGSGSDFTYEGVFTNYGVIDVADDATLTFNNEGIYDHARDGGDLPTATWDEGSTLYVSGTVTSAPGNGNQDFYDIVIDAEGNIENNDLGMMDNTIFGDIDVLSTGTARFYLSNPDSFDSLYIEIMGDIYMGPDASAFSSNGTGSGATEINIHHYGDIVVDGGNFSISRGSGPIVNWYMYEGSITMNAGETQNSNARATPKFSAFIFAGEDTVQYLDVSDEFEISHLPIRVASESYLDMGTSNLSESGDHFELEAGGTLASSDSAAFSSSDGGNLELGGSGDTQLTLSTEGNYVINGSEPQATGFALPLQIASLTIDNEAGVVQSRGVTITESLNLLAGVFDNQIGFTLADGATINEDGGSLLIPIGGLEIGEFALTSPEDGFELNLTGETSTEVVISWEEASSPIPVTYTWHADSVGGDFSDPLVSIESDDEGAAKTLTLTYAAIDDVVADLGVAEGDNIDLIWTVTAEADDVVGFATEPFDLNIARNLNVSNEVDDKPKEFALSQNYPNPFNPTTSIKYDVPEASDVSLEVFDITGRKIAELVDARKSAGSYTVQWNARNFATGVYIYRLTAGDFTAVRKLTLIK